MDIARLAATPQKQVYLHRVSIKVTSKI